MYGTDRVDSAEVEGPKGLADEALTGLLEANNLHSALDELELRLFGPQPPANTMAGIGKDEANSARPALATAVRASRQRLESATSRIGRIISRL